MKRNLLVLTLFLICVLPAYAENDGGTTNRALETAIVSPQLDGVLLRRGYATLPNGYLYNGYYYMYTHLYLGSVWRPAGLTWCSQDVAGNEIKVLYKVNLASITSKATLVGRVSPCSDVLGTVNGNNAHGIGGTGAIGGNNKFYLTTNRTSCTTWTQGCMDNEYLGAVANPDSTAYAWQLSPILASSTVNSRTLNWNGFIALKSFTQDPLPSASLFPRQTSDIGQARLWGYAQYGFIDGGDLPSHLARVQIVETATATRPNWATTRIYVYGSDLSWHPVPAGGVINFVPYDALADFGYRSVTSVYYDSISSKYVGVSEEPAYQGLTSGCDETAAGWYTAVGGPFYHAPWVTNYATATLTPMGSGSSLLLTNDTYTQNTLQVGGTVVTVNGQRYLLRGSTERICLQSPNDWWDPWIGAEITVEQIPNTPL